MNLTIEQIVARIPAWRGERPEIEPLPGGITNLNFRVRVGERAYFVRLPAATSHLLGIDRENEVHNMRLAATAGLAPRVIHFLPAEGVLVTEFVAGEPVDPARLQRPELQRRLVRLLRALHAGPRFRRDFNMFRRAERYAATIRAEGLPLPADYPDVLPHLAEMERALLPAPAVPCHNDLVPGNVLDDGRRLILVDFDYSGNNDPCFELGNLFVEMNLDDDQAARLVHAYFGRAGEADVARAQLHGLMSDVGWALWSVIQASLSTLAFDFAGYGARRWRRAAGKLRSADFERWLRAVRRGR